MWPPRPLLVTSTLQRLIAAVLVMVHIQQCARFGAMAFCMRKADLMNTCHAQKRFEMLAGAALLY
jgi:hypothetical protein